MHSDLSSRQMNALAQPIWGGRWPVAVENVLAQGSGTSCSSSQEQGQAQAAQAEEFTQELQQPVSSQDGLNSETGAQCMWQLDARAVFPPGTCVWPAIFMTGDGCFTGFPVGSVLPSQDVTQQAPTTGASQSDVAQPPVTEANASNGSNGSTSPRNGISRTSTSRKQRRRLKAANTATADSVKGPAADEQLEKAQPALPGLVNGPRGAQQVSAAPACPGPLPESLEEPAPTSPTSANCEGPGQLWPPTPESTPPCSPRDFGPSFCAFPGIWHVEIPSMVLPEPVALPEMSSMQAEEVPDAESQACEQMISQLDEDASRRAEVMELLWTSTWSMACTPGGTRVVQKALEVADTTERISLAEQLQGHVREAFASPHANHVLQKCIELIPPDRLHFVLSEMLGHAVAAARHRYGCRVLERLLEHCPSEQTAPLVEEVLAGAPQLCRHTFGNFVVQHVLEHGTVDQKRQIVDVIHADIQRLARHRVASHVVRCALKHSPLEDRQKLVQAIRKDPADLADLAHHHCGSFVVREMRRADVLHR
ncbi:APUM1 [Symbiodinium natans]|uniref:APUM1 protein n=1 Tax=Symbiodinium natans TaxID=878477 RepID=A0A812UZH1_9DINO|nr:APUM1 [Symbiodinium natans]